MAGSVTGAESRTDPVVSSPGDVIAFSRHCADERPYRVQAYALLEAPSQQARALVQVQAGFFGVEQFISIVVGLEALALNAGADWGNRTFSLRLLLQPAAGTTVEGPVLSTWYDAEEWRPPAEPPTRRFTTTAKGQTRWLTSWNRARRLRTSTMTAITSWNPCALPFATGAAVSPCAHRAGDYHQGPCERRRNPYGRPFLSDTGTNLDYAASASHRQGA